MDDGTAFAPRTALILIGVGVAAMVGWVAATTIEERAEPSDSFRANAYSRSAIGHRAFFEVLRRQGVRVLVSRFNSADKAGADDLLVVAEPGPRADTVDELLDAPKVLLVLPKWQGFPHAETRGWIKNVTPRGRSEAADLLHRVAPEARLKRVARITGWTRTVGGARPQLDSPQLIAPGRNGVRPLVAAREGILLGETRGPSGGRLWILSDPDLIANHGLDKGNNALAAVEAVERLRNGGAVVVDETVHGFKQSPSVLVAMVSFPFVVTTLAGVVAVLVLIWAAAARFGGPLPARTPLLPGKAGLIDSAAGLFQSAGRRGQILDGYVKVARREVAQRLHAPPGLRGADLTAWLDRVGERRGVSRSFSDLRRRADLLQRGRADTRHAALARELYRWKQEMIHGSAGHRVD